MYVYKFSYSQVSPQKMLRIAFGIRALSSSYIQRVFVKTEMTLKSKMDTGSSRALRRSKSSENLPSSQSQVNIQMMSRTLTIREVRYTILFVVEYFLELISLYLRVICNRKYSKSRALMINVCFVAYQ